MTNEELIQGIAMDLPDLELEYIQEAVNNRNIFKLESIEHMLKLAKLQEECQCQDKDILEEIELC